MQGRAVLAELAVGLQSAHYAVEPGRVNVELVGELRDGDPGTVADEPQDVLLSLAWGHGATARARGPLRRAGASARRCRLRLRVGRTLPPRGGPGRRVGGGAVGRGGPGRGGPRL